MLPGNAQAHAPLRITEVAQPGKVCILATGNPLRRSSYRNRGTCFLQEGLFSCIYLNSGEFKSNGVKVITKKTYQDVFDFKAKRSCLKADDMTVFKSEVDKQKRLQGMTNQDIADKTGYSKHAIDSYMCGYRDSKKVEIAIAIALGLEDYLVLS